MAVYKVNRPIKEDVEAEETRNFEEAFSKVSSKSDFVVIDTPGNDTSRLAHSYADTLITPTNDSFIDLG